MEGLKKCILLVVQTEEKKLPLCSDQFSCLTFSPPHASVRSPNNNNCVQKTSSREIFAVDEAAVRRRKSVDHQDNQLNDQENFDSFQITFNPVNNGAFFPQPQVSDRGFGLLGIIGGCLLLFIFLVIITCMRQRKLYKVK